MDFQVRGIPSGWCHQGKGAFQFCYKGEGQGPVLGTEEHEESCRSESKWLSGRSPGLARGK